MKKLISYLRVEEWLSSKVTFMLGIFLFLAYLGNGETGDIAKNAVAFFLYVSMFLAVSYVANDFSDLEIDRRAGKKKVIAGMPRWMIWASFALMAAAGNAYVLIRARNKLLCAVLIAVTYFLGLAYSTLGIRFKERGLLGLIECSFAQRCMPLLMIACLEEVNGASMWLLLAWVILSFVDGLRYIIIHQVIDLENDIVTGVNTYVAEKRGNYRNALIAFFAGEAIAVAAIMIPLWIREPIVTGAIVAADAFLEYCIFMVIQKYAGKDIFATYDSVPLEGFLNMLFPALAAVCLATIHPAVGLSALLALIAFCAKPFIVKYKIAAIYVRPEARRGR